MTAPISKAARAPGVTTISPKRCWRRDREEEQRSRFSRMAIVRLVGSQAGRQPVAPMQNELVRALRPTHSWRGARRDRSATGALHSSSRAYAKVSSWPRLSRDSSALRATPLPPRGPSVSRAGMGSLTSASSLIRDCHRPPGSCDACSGLYAYRRQLGSTSGVCRPLGPVRSALNQCGSARVDQPVSGESPPVGSGLRPPSA